jgi:hypothetical protein
LRGLRAAVCSVAVLVFVAQSDEAQVAEFVHERGRDVPGRVAGVHSHQDEVPEGGRAAGSGAHHNPRGTADGRGRAGILPREVLLEDEARFRDLRHIPDRRHLTA